MKKSAKMPMARGGMKTMKVMKGGSRTKKGKKKSVKKSKKK